MNWLVPAAFLLVYFLSLKESTCETRRNFFLFQFKNSFCSWENLEFQIFKFYNGIKKYILLNNLGIKQILLMKFDRFTSHYTRKKLVKKFYKKCYLNTTSKPFCVCKELSTTSIGTWNLWGQLLILDMK